jgi:3-deoxy-D-arabino-heptulosonate 7-phosphate (DAHP) synthase
LSPACKLFGHPIQNSLARTLDFEGRYMFTLAAVVQLIHITSTPIIVESTRGIPRVILTAHSIIILAQSDSGKALAQNGRYGTVRL